LRISDSRFKMGVWTESNRLARGVREYKFRTGPYRVRVKRNDQSVKGASYHIECLRVDDDE
jgi:hypothetical protein